MGHPSVGASWEGFIIENIIIGLTDQWRYSYYRTLAGAEVDLVLEAPNREVWAIEVKRSIAPKITILLLDTYIPMEQRNEVFKRIEMLLQKVLESLEYSSK